MAEEVWLPLHWCLPARREDEGAKKAQRLEAFLAAQPTGVSAPHSLRDLRASGYLNSGRKSEIWNHVILTM